MQTTIKSKSHNWFPLPRLERLHGKTLFGLGAVAPWSKTLHMKPHIWKKLFFSSEIGLHMQKFSMLIGWEQCRKLKLIWLPAKQWKHSKKKKKMVHRWGESNKFYFRVWEKFKFKQFFELSGLHIETQPAKLTNHNAHINREILVIKYDTHRCCSRGVSLVPIK